MRNFRYAKTQLIFFDKPLFSEPCGFDAMVTEDIQTFSSPGYPSAYPNFARCEWNLESPNGTRIRIDFQAFVLESSFDYVIVSPLDNFT